jgi:hypothetical protein
MFWTFYVISAIYCFYHLSKRWNRDVMPGGLGINPGLDTLAVLFLAPVLMVVDVILTWIRIYKEAEEARRKNNKIY